MHRRIFLLFALLISTIAAIAQTGQFKDTKDEKMQKRAIEKRIEAIQDSIRSAEAFSALKQLDFVLEANRLSFNGRANAYVTSNTNFISLANNKVVIQVAPFNGGGPNGVGGITLEGRASNIKVKTDKKGNISLTMNAMGTGLSATIDIFLPKNGYMASATVTPNFHSNGVTLFGNLLPTDKSDIFKGRLLF